MNSGINLNALICLIIFISTISTSIYIFRKRGGEKVNLFLSLFWFFASLTWLAVFIDLLFYLNGRLDLDLIINQYFVQFFVFAQLTFGIYYGIFRVTKKEKLSLLLFFFSALFSVLALYYMYLPDGLAFRNSTYFSVEYTINAKTWNIFQFVASIGLLSLFFDLIRFVFFWIAKKEILELKYMLSSLAIFVYGILGYFDNMGYNATWLMVLLRMFMIFSAFIAYIAFSKKEELSEVN